MARSCPTPDEAHQEVEHKYSIAVTTPIDRRHLRDKVAKKALIHALGPAQDILHDGHDVAATHEVQHVLQEVFSQINLTEHDKKLHKHPYKSFLYRRKSIDIVVYGETLLQHIEHGGSLLGRENKCMSMMRPFL